MGDTLVRQTLSIIAGKTPLQTNANITERDYQVDPPELLIIEDLNENTSHRFVVDPGKIDEPLCMGTITEGQLFVLKSETDLQFKIATTAGVSQLFTLIANRRSVMHVPFTDILVTNTTAEPIKGTFFVAGD